MPADESLIQAEVIATHAQIRFWDLQQLAGTSLALPIVLELRGLFNREALAAAIDATIIAYEVLRTCFVSVGGVLQQRIMRHVTLPIATVDLSGFGGMAARDIALAQLPIVAARPIEMTDPPLLRVVVFRLSRNRHIVQMMIHHALVDDWSVSLLTKSIAEQYQAACQGRLAVLRERLPYRVVGTAMETGAVDPEREHSLAFWRATLNGAPPLTAPPTDHPRRGQRSFRTSRSVRPFRRSPPAAIDAALTRLGTTRFGLLSGSLALLLGRLADSRDVMMAVGVTGRRRRGLDDVLGPLMNTMVLRVDLRRARSLAAATARATAAFGAALPHAALPFDVLYRELRPHADPGAAPFAQVLLLYRAGVHAFHAMGDLHAQSIDMPIPVSPYDLTFTIVVDDAGLLASCDYANELYDEDTVRNYLSLWEDIIARGLAAPEQAIGALAPAPAPANAVAEVREGWLELLTRVAAQRAQASALIEVATRQIVSYGELTGATRRVALALATAGIAPGSAVGVCLPRGVDLWIVCIGVAMAGCAYVALRYRDAAPTLADHARGDALAAVIGDEVSLAALEGAVPGLHANRLLGFFDDRPGEPACPPLQALAYIMRTSGSTGRPKGVEITHRSLRAAIDAFVGEPWFGPHTRMLSVTDITFDIAALEVFGPLCAGGCVLIAPEGSAGDGAALGALLDASGANALQATPFTWSLLMQHNWRPAAGFLALCGGEAASQHLACELAALPSGAFNLYGPTETTIWSARAPMHGREHGEHIGQALPGETLHVLDGMLDPVAPGGIGELFIGGVGLANGYRNDPAATAAAFLPDPGSNVPGARMYRTGDRFQLDCRGALTFRGRSDQQVKIRGFRIELDGIGRCLARHPQVAECVATCTDHPTRGPCVVAYVRPLDDAPVTLSELRRYARASLPVSSLPAAYVTLAAFPTTSSNKVDRRRLPPPEERHFVDRRASATPATATEQAVAKLWSEVLGNDDIGIDDDFFERGGASLDAIRVAARIAAELAPGFTFAMFLDAPTVARTAALIDSHAIAPGPTLPVATGTRIRIRKARLSQHLRKFVAHALTTGADSQPTVQHVVRLQGPCNAAALKHAFAVLNRRHEALRSHFGIDSDGPFLTAVDPQSIKPHWQAVDLRGQDKTAVARTVARFVEDPFDLRRAPLCRAALFQLGEHDHVLAFCASHLVLDGWSLRLLANQFADLYHNRPAPAAHGAKTHPEFSDYLDWEAAWLGSDAGAAALNARLRGLLPCPGTAFAPVPGAPALLGTLSAQVEGAVLSALLQSATRQRSTPFVAVLTAVFNALARISGLSNLAVMTPAANRADNALLETVGLMMNPVIVRHFVPAQPAADDMQRVRRELNAALEYQHLPVNLLIEAVRCLRPADAQPAIQTFVVWNDNTAGVPGWTGLTASGFPLPQTRSGDDGANETPLQFDFVLLAGRLEITLTHRLDYINPQDAVRLLDVLLGSIAALGAGIP